MNQQQELPQTREELNARIDQLWREELEWVRQHPNPDLTEFSELIKKETHKSNVKKLPPLDIAMWPADVLCNINIGNTEKFNDHFIEPPMETRASGGEKIFWGFHNGMVLLLLSHLIIGNEDPISLLLFYLIVLVVIGPIIYFVTFRFGKEKLGRTRYNRQAQLVHIDNGKGHVAHIPWRNAVPLVQTGFWPSSMMRICVPRPQADAEEFNLRTSRAPGTLDDNLRDIYGIDIALSNEDHSSIHSNLQRLEFMRRYMEHGLQAIQPHPQAIEQGLVKDPEQRDAPKRICATGWDGKYVIYPLGRIWHYFCFGPWLDSRARRRLEGFEWNDEVKNLCGPNPDLRGLNTRPVKSRTDVYYRPDGASYRLVDRWGNPLRFEPAKQA